MGEPHTVRLNGETSDSLENYADDHHNGNAGDAMRHLIDRGLLRKGYGDGAKAISTPLATSARLLAQAFLAVSLGLLLIHVMTPFTVLYGVLGFLLCGALSAVAWNREPQITHWYARRQREQPVATDGGK